MIKIAFVIDTIESPTAGTEKQLLLLIRHLDRTKFQPFLCVLQSSPWLQNEFSDCEVIPIGVLSFKKSVTYLNLIKFALWLRKEHIDIVQTHFVEANKVGILAGKLAGVRAIVSTRRNQGYWHNKGELLVLKILNRWVTRFVANSESTKQWAVKAEKINTHRISVIHNGLEIDSFFKGTEKQRNTLREQLGFPGNAILLGVVSNLRPVKSIDVFIRAVQKVVKSHPQARFVIVGEGPEKAVLEKLCCDLGLADTVCFLGKRLDVPMILSCLDIGVLASSSESFSNAIVEYMASGLAVVCTDVGGAKEAVEDHVNGYIVAPGDCSGMAERINTLIEKDLYADMGRQGRQKAELLFSFEPVLGRYQHLYEEMV